MRKNAFGAIDLLIGLVLTTFIFIVCMNMIRPVESGDSNIKSVQQEVDRQISEIEDMRRQVQEYEKEILE